MKYLLMLLLATTVLFSNYDVTDAQEKQSVEKDDRYFSSEDILFTLTKPKIDKAVKEQYDEKLAVNPSQLKDIAFMTDLEKGPSSWYEVEFYILVGEPDNPNLDSIKLKIDAPNIGNDKMSKPLEVELIEYSKLE